MTTLKHLTLALVALLFCVMTVHALPRRVREAQDGSEYNFSQMDFDTSDKGDDTRVWTFIGVAGIGSLLVLCGVLGVFVWWARSSLRELRGSGTSIFSSSSNE